MFDSQGCTTSVLAANIGRREFRDHVLWLERHVGAHGHAWQVRYLEDTGIRTLVIFENPRHKLLFDIAWANTVSIVDHQLPKDTGHRDF